MVITATGEPNLTLEIKRIDPDCQTIYVGPLKKTNPNSNSIYRQGDNGITARTDISAYTVAKGAMIYAYEQNRPSVPQEAIARATYEAEPTVAQRVFNVDQCGNPYAVDNPFPVQLSDGSISIGTVNAELEVQLSHQDNVPDAGDVADSVQIGDGAEILQINPDGSINVDIISNSNTPTITIVDAIIKDVEVSFTIPTGTKKITFRVRNGYGMSKFAWVAGNTDTDNYMTLRHGSLWEEDKLDTVAGLTLYIQTNKPNQKIEIQTWERV